MYELLQIDKQLFLVELCGIVSSDVYTETLVGKFLKSFK